MDSHYVRGWNDCIKDRTRLFYRTRAGNLVSNYEDMGSDWEPEAIEAYVAGFEAACKSVDGLAK
jgi:hypothetical protein